MTIDQIESFVAVASSGSISQAAARLFRSQPNLSYSLKQLEAELGYPLLVRTNQGVTLTSGAIDEKCAIRQSHNNPDIIKVYKDFLGEPCSELSEELLHTTYVADRPTYLPED